MKCTVSKKDLTRMLTRCKGAADTKSEHVHVHCVLLSTKGNTLSAFATNLTLSMYTETQCAVEQQGACAVNIEKLRNAVAAMPDGMITLKTDLAKNATTVSCTGHRKYTIHGLDPKSFPTRELPPKLDWYTLPLKVVQEAIERTKASMAVEQGRPGMNGIMFEFSPKLFRAITINGYTMQYFEHPGAYDHPDGVVFMPTSTIAMIAASADDVSFAYTDRAVFVNTGVDRMSALLPTAGFPDWKFIREGCPKTVMCKLDVLQMLAAVKAVTAVTKGDVQLELKNSELRITLVRVPDSEGEDVVMVNAEAGAAFRVIAHPEHLMNVLEGCSAGIASFIHDLHDSKAPLVFIGDDGFFGLVQPVEK